MSKPITILWKVAETYDGLPQWEVEQGGERAYMTLAEIKYLMGAA